MKGPLAVVRDRIRAGAPVALATVVEIEAEQQATPARPAPFLGAKLVVSPDAPVSGSLGDATLDSVVAREAAAALEDGLSFTRRYGARGEPHLTDVTVFVEVFASPRRMIIFGAVDFSAALARQGKLLGFQVTVCDARATFATPARFPEADQVVVDWPDRYLATAGGLGPADAVCVLTHDNKFDVPAIVAALATSVGYIGVMGSRRTHANRIERLRQAGVDEAGLSRLMAPIGIDIGARSPEETAVSIAAEIIGRRSGAPVPSLSEGAGPIHRPPPDRPARDGPAPDQPAPEVPASDRGRP